MFDLYLFLNLGFKFLALAVIYCLAVRFIKAIERIDEDE